MSETVGIDTTTSRGTTITSGTTHVKSAGWTQLVAATAFDASMIIVMLDDCNAGIDGLLDIAIGAGGAEVVLFSNLGYSSGTGSLVYGGNYHFPVKIPAGSRLSAKCQMSTVSGVVRVSCILFSPGFLPGQPLSLVTTYGANTADSGGVSVDPGGTANTEGTAYSEIVASTTYPIRFLSIYIGNQINTARTSCSWLVDVAIGAGGAEVVILTDLVLNTSSSPDTICPQTYNLIPVNIPAGTRIAVRARCSINDATDRLFDVIMYGAS